MEDFNVYTVATTQQEATFEISDRIEKMQQLFAECVYIAQAFDMRLVVDLPLPPGTEGGHNQDMTTYWSASASNC